MKPTACQTCGFPDRAAADGLCPRCLLRAAALSPVPALASSPQAPTLPAQAPGTPAKALPRPFGKYILRDQLDHGGMGVVYRAYEPGADRIVALKMLKDWDQASIADVTRFEGEARKSAGLHQDGIVPVFDVDVHDGQPYFTMRLMEGGSVAQHAAEFRGKPDDAAILVAEVARAVHHAHQRLILHRDLKPANILLDADGRPHIADFGIARRLDEKVTSSANQVSGTLPYMAPEQIQTPNDLTVAADVYGVGAILYELLCGRPPIEGNTAAEIIKNVIDVEPVPPRRMPGGAAIHLDLDAICCKCLRKSAAERYASAAGLAADLDRYLADEPVTARRPSMSERAARMLRRHPLAAGLAAVALVLLVGTTAAAVSVARAQEAELRAEVLTVNAYAARALSGAVRYELRALADDVSRAASDPTVLAVLRAPRDPAAAAAWRAAPRSSRFDSMQILDTDCRWITRAPDTRPELAGQLFDWRDYCARAAQLGRSGRHGVHVSRAYVSTADGTTRFSLVAPVYDAAGRWIGVVSGAVDSDTALGGLTLIDPGEQHRMAALVARRDRARRDDALPDDWMVLLHDGVARGSDHRMTGRGGLAALSAVSAQSEVARPSPAVTDDDHHDPVPGFDGRWLAGFAAVGDAPFAVIVQTRHEAAVAPNQRLASRMRAVSGVALGVALVACAALFWVGRARRRR